MLNELGHQSHNWVTYKLNAHPALLADDSSAVALEQALKQKSAYNTAAKGCLPRRVSIGAVLEVMDWLARAYTVLK